MRLKEFVAEILAADIADLDRRLTSPFAIVDTLPDDEVLSIDDQQALLDKLRGARCEEVVWNAILWKRKTTLSFVVAQDLIDRRIAVRAVADTRQIRSVRGLVAKFDPIARVELVKEVYLDGNSTDAELEVMLRAFGDEAVLKALAYLRPSSKGKLQVFSSLLGPYPAIADLAARTARTALVRSIEVETEPNRLVKAYELGDANVNLALASNEATPLSILEELGNQRGATGTEARRTLRQVRRSMEKFAQVQIAPISTDRTIDDRHRWDDLSEKDKEQASVDLARALPAEFAFTALASYELGANRHVIAVFRWKKSEFVLVPGGEVTLGLGRDAEFPSALHEADWRPDSGIEPEDLLSESFTADRRVRVAPFLIERKAVRLSEGDAFDKVQRRVERAGFRLPSSDEWEYACSGGARTLFRWGNEYPKDRTPIDAGDFRKHESVNAFGLHLPSSPYDWELVDDPSIMRGGDGGTLLCGGASGIAAWIPLSTFFVMPNENPEELYGAHVRRVRSV